MIKIFLLLLTPFLLYATKILNYNVYDRTDRVDVMLTFDTPYNGIVKQRTTDSKIILTLENVTIEAQKSKKISSKYVQTLMIVPLQNSTQIIAVAPTERVRFLASKTTDGYGLRLRFTSKATHTKQRQTSSAQNSLAMLPTKKDENISKSYYIVISIMVIGIFILLYIKRKVVPNKETPKKVKKDAWLFESTQKSKQTPQQNELNSVTIRFQKTIDSDNSVVMLDFAEQSYLVLMGKSNILLDKFRENKPTSQQEFESILQSRNDELESFLATSSKHKDERNDKTQEPLQAYKEKAATLLYSDNQ